jgi:4-amino-4-deoxy-L-arabinose transferase-like glycosyltransferase
MAVIEVPGARVEPRPPFAPSERIRRRGPFPAWHRFALGSILLLSIFMNFFRLGTGGFANQYYAASVRSMLDSLHNFLFVSYDPGGFVTLDKPPLGFWLQVASAKLLGFTPFSILLPQAVAGVLSVGLLSYLVRRGFGVVAGLLAALALAVSPISVVTNRNNTIDSTLALVILLGAWAVMRAAETGKLRFLLLRAVVIGIGFNVKMLEAYLVVPAFGLLYLLGAPHRIGKRAGHLAVAGALMLAISLSWVTAVDLTPAALRHWVGSTQSNSELSLALGYNGVDRLLGQIYLLSAYPTWARRLDPVIALGVGFGIVALIGARVSSGRNGASRPIRLRVAAAIAVLALLVAPAVWAGIPVIENVAVGLPAVGPPGGGGSATSESTLASYLVAHQGTATYLVAVDSSNQADPLILATNRPVMALGGFQGSDPILTVDQFARLVQTGAVRYALFSTGGFDGPGGGQQSAITRWIEAHGTVLPAGEWGGSSGPPRFGGGTLYYLGG